MHHSSGLSAWLCASGVLFRSWELILRSGRCAVEGLGVERRVAGAVDMLSGDELRSFGGIGHDQRVHVIVMPALKVWHVPVDVDEGCLDARDMLVLLLPTPFYVHLVRDSVRDQLESIIRAGTVTARALANQATHVISRLSLSSIENESVAEILDSLGFETRQSTVQHQLNNMAQVVTVLSCRKIGLNSELLKPSVRLARSAATHDRDHLGGKLEGGALKFDATGGDVEAESEVNVDDMTRIVDHDVAIVSVFELQQKTDDAVRGHGFDEVATCGLEADAVFVAIAADEVIVQPVDGFAA